MAILQRRCNLSFILHGICMTLRPKIKREKGKDMKLDKDKLLGFGNRRDEKNDTMVGTKGQKRRRRKKRKFWW